MGFRVLHRDKPDAMLPMIASDARLIAWPGTGAETANMNYVVMAAGEENVPHLHRDSEDTIYVLSGRGTIADLTNGAELEFEANQVIHVPAGVEHQVRADRGSDVVSVGGPCPADRDLFVRLGLLPDDSGE
jgi:quercetin dioxygenase-like cupin family protein